MVRHNPAGRQRERGVALIAALLSLMLLSAIALGMMYSANMETDININYRDSLKAEYAARAGIEEVRARMKLATGATGAITLPTVMPASGAGVVYVLNPRGSETVAPWSSANTYFDTELCHESYYSTISNPGAGVFCTAVPSGTSWRTTTGSADPNSGTNNAMDYKWVRIAFKGNGSAAPYYVNNSSASGTLATQVCWDSTSSRQVVSAGCSGSNKPVYMLTSLAVTTNGSRRMAQEEVVSLSLPPLPSAVTLTGTPTFGAPNSNPYHIDGTDHADSSCGNVTGPAVDAIGVTNDSAVTTVTSAIPHNRTSHYTGLGSAPDVANISSSMGTLGTTSGLVILTSTVKNMASTSNRYTGNQSGINIGSTGSPQVTFVDGDLNLSGNVSGAGILFVTGSLSTSGNFSYKGIIYVVGDGVWNANGGGNGEVDGAVFIANIYNSTTHNSGTLRSSPGVGSVTLDWGGGGGNGIYYNSCWINKLGSGLGFTTISMKEMPY